MPCSLGVTQHVRTKGPLTLFFLGGCRSLLATLLVWTPCLMHRCVSIWQYIIQNYNYKLHFQNLSIYHISHVSIGTLATLHFQNLSIYHIPHVSIGTLATENLDVCTACDLWDSNIQLTMVKDRRPGPGMPFLDSDTCADGGFLPCMMPSMDGWWDKWMDGKSFTTMTSFTICNLWPPKVRFRV
jgi:hypothetical protein